MTAVSFNFPGKMKAEKKGGGSNADRNLQEEAKSLHSTRSIDRCSWLRTKTFIFFFPATPGGCNVLLQ